MRSWHSVAQPLASRAIMKPAVRSMATRLSMDSSRQAASLEMTHATSDGLAPCSAARSAGSILAAYNMSPNSGTRRTAGVVWRTASRAPSTTDGWPTLVGEVRGLVARPLASERMSCATSTRSELLSRPGTVSKRAAGRQLNLETRRRTPVVAAIRERTIQVPVHDDGSRHALAKLVAELSSS